MVHVFENSNYRSAIADSVSLRDSSEKSGSTKNRLSYFLAVMDDSVLADAPDRIKTKRDRKKFAIFVHKFTTPLEGCCSPEPDNQTCTSEGRRSEFIYR